MYFIIAMVIIAFSTIEQLFLNELYSVKPVVLIFILLTCLMRYYHL